MPEANGRRVARLLGMRSELGARHALWLTKTAQQLGQPTPSMPSNHGLGASAARKCWSLWTRARGGGRPGSGPLLLAASNNTRAQPDSLDDAGDLGQIIVVREQPGLVFACGCEHDRVRQAQAIMRSS